MNELSYKKYSNELNKIYNNTPKPTKGKKYYLIDELSDEFLIKKYKLYLKYKNTKDIELKFELNYVKYFYKFKIYLYFIICSYYNKITTFYYENKEKKTY
jgi:hypothetical protein